MSSRWELYKYQPAFVVIEKQETPGIAGVDGPV
jgi:hypothetical protein